jgi:signal peptidase II
MLCKDSYAMLGRRDKPVPISRPRLAQLLAMAVYLIDQLSKFWVVYILGLGRLHVLPVIPPFFDLVMVWNGGVTFGLFQAGSRLGQLVLAGVAITVCFCLFRAIVTAPNTLRALCYGAIAGGAVGNVTDRVMYGRVVDFIHLHWGAFDPFPYVFNIGDSVIVISVGLLLLDSFRPSLPNPGEAA